MDMQEIRRANLQRIVDQYGTKAELGRQTDVNPTYVSQILTGKRPIREVAARNMEHDLGIDPYSLDKPAPLDDAAASKPPTTGHSPGSGTSPQIQGEVALLSSVEAGKLGKEYPFPPMQGRKMIKHISEVGPRSFAMLVEDDSMTAPAGTTIPEGHIAIIDIDADYENGAIVAVKRKSDKGAIIRKLVIDGPNRYLRPLNPVYGGATLVDDDCRIIGEVIDAVVRIKKT